MAKPTKAKIEKFFNKAFPKEEYVFDEGYFQEWVGRFESPRRVWSHSDYDRRELLKEMFPSKFGNLDKDANLNNPEYMIPKYSEW